MKHIRIILAIAAIFGFAAAGFGETITAVVSTKAGDLVISQTAAGPVSYSQISLKGAGRATSVVGCPQLPIRLVRIALPFNAVVTGFHATASDTATISLQQPLIPSQPPVPLNDGPAPVWSAPVNGVYQSNALYPSEIAAITRISALSEYKIVEISVYPVRYNPAAGQLSVSSVINVTLEYALAPGKQIAVQRRSAVAQDAIASMVRATVTDQSIVVSRVRIDAPRPAGKTIVTEAPSLNGPAVDCVIITSEGLKDSFRALAEWRTRTGIATEIRTVEWIDQNFAGVDLQEKIRLFIQASWSQWGTAFVLLGGAPSVVPARYVPWTAWPGYIPDLRVPTDLYYSDIVDTCYGQDAHRYTFNYNRNGQYGELDNQADRVDLQPDVFLGRAPVETPAQAAAFVAKVLRYEQHPPAGFGSSFLMMADGCFAPLTEMVNTMPLMTAAPWVDPLEQYTPASGSGWSGDEVLNASSAVSRLNQGYNMVYHIDHGGIYSLGTAVGSGGGWLYRTEAQTLVNTARPSIVVTPACSPNAFDDESFSKSMINNPNGGAVAFIGNTRVGFTDQAWQCQAFFVALYQERAPRLGEAFNRLIDAGYDYARLSMNLLGDPAMPVWTAEPETLTVIQEITGAGSVKRVAVTVAVQGSGDTAVVCLHKDGEINVVAQVVLPGTVLFSIEPLSSGYLDITVTGHNLRPYLDSCPIAPPSAPPARITSIGCLDDTADNAGNGDLVANPGEAIMICPLITVNPDSSLEQLTVTLVMPDTAISVATGSVTFSHLLAGSAVNQGSLDRKGFLVKVSPSARSGDAPLRFSCSSVTPLGLRRSWQQSAVLAICADSLVYQTHRLSIQRVDRPKLLAAGSYHDRDYDRMIVLDSITIANLGIGASGNMTVRLRSDDPAVLIIDSVSSLGVIGPHTRSIGTAPLRLLIRSGRPAAAAVANLVLCDQNGRASIQRLSLVDSLPVPTGVIAWSAGGSVLVSWNAPVYAPYKGYLVYRSSPGNDTFHVINRSLVEGSSVFTDSTISPNTRYVYAVSCVDSFGNQSDVSTAQDTVRSQPGMKPGFPAAMGIGGRGNRMWGSPGVGDINGDGFPEIVMGGDDGKVYAIDHRGAPLPGWPVTIGYQIDNSTPVLADIDQDGQLEVILGNGAWYTASGDGKVHAFKGDGTEAPGWPQPVIGDAFASCAVADVNNDGTLAIAAATTAGYAYLWNGAGQLLPGWPRIVGDRVAASPAVGDLDGDGLQEIIIASTSAGALQLNVLRHDGTPLAGWPRTIAANAGYALSSPALADLDGDGALEIIQAGAAEAPYGQVKIHAFKADGAESDGWPVSVSPNTSILASPAIGDLNGNGATAVVICTSDGIVHAFSNRGMNLPLWQAALPSNGRTNAVIADVNGDGHNEVVLTTEQGNLYALNGNDGAITQGFPLWIESSWSAPVVSDIDRDGKLDLVASGWGSHKLFAWSLGAADHGAQSWNTFQGNNGRTGCYLLANAPQRSAGNSSAAAAAPRLPTALFQNHPNPVAGRTTIDYQISSPGRASLKVYNMAGQLVSILFSGLQSAGRHQAQWLRTNDQGSQIASGTYLYRLETDGHSDVKRMVVVK